MSMRQPNPRRSAPPAPVAAGRAANGEGLRTDAPRRAGLATFLLVTIGIACLARLLYWQVLDRQRLLDAAQAQAAQSIVEAPVRGTITDSSGTVVLATTVLRQRLTARPVAIPAAERPAIAKRLAELVGGGATAEASFGALLASGRAWGVLHPGLEDDPAARVREAIAAGELPGIGLEQVRFRSYPQPGGVGGTSLASQLLGFVNADGVGQYGVEGYYDAALAGAARVTSIERAADGSLKTTESAAGRPSADLRLCIDARVQAMVEQEAAVAGISDGAESVSVVVMDPYTGAIISSASWPSYDANDYAAVASRNPQLLADPTISSTYEPGSVMKAITAVAALEDGVATPQSLYQDEKVLLLDNGASKVRNANLQSRGTLSLTEALAYSRNVVFTKVALQLGATTASAADRLYASWLRFGIGGQTGVDLAGEERGIARDPGAERWRQIDLANASFGQGVSTTLMQLAVAYSAMVNGGILVRPRVVAAVDGVPTPITARGAATTPEVSRQMIQMTAAAPKIVPLYQRLAALPAYVYGGKTGTAQIWRKDANGGQGAFDERHYNFTFVGWFGKTAPDYVIAVSIRRATPVVHGPGLMENRIESFELFRRVAQDLISVYGITPASVSDGRSTSPAHPGSPEPSAPALPAVGGVPLLPVRPGRPG